MKKAKAHFKHSHIICFTFWAIYLSPIYIVSPGFQKFPFLFPQSLFRMMGYFYFLFLKTLILLHKNYGLRNLQSITGEYKIVAGWWGHQPGQPAVGGVSTAHNYLKQFLMHSQEQKKFAYDF